MKFWITLLSVSVPVGCGASFDMVTFGNLNIPESYVLHESGDVPKGVFDESSQTIALIMPEEEIQASIPEYQAKQKGSKAVSLVLYEEPLHLPAISASVWSGLDAGASAVKEDRYTSYIRHYRDGDSWLLANENTELVALCRKSGITGEIEICEFMANVRGFGVKYYLQNQNISLAKQFENYVADKLTVWSK